MTRASQRVLPKVYLVPVADWLARGQSPGRTVVGDAALATSSIKRVRFGERSLARSKEPADPRLLQKQEQAPPAHARHRDPLVTI